MEIDFHFAVTYVIARMAGFDHAPAETVATASQYVDDTVSEGTIRFYSGEAYTRISTAHEKINPKILFSSAERRVWVPFHFLPSDEQTPTKSKIRFYDTLVCRPNSLIAQEMLRHCEAQKSSPSALHRLGITAHVFVDTWAHQGFVGVNHIVNRAGGIELKNVSSLSNPFAHLKHSFQSQGVKASIDRFWFTFISKFLNWIFPMGHGAVLHYPDWPFLKWSYIDYRGVKIERDNPTDYMSAVEALFQYFSRYLDPNTPRSMPDSDRKLIAQMLSDIQMEDGDERCNQWITAIANGHFSFGPAKIEYFAKGPKSWKFKAIGTEKNTDHWWERFEYSPQFIMSDWKLFHDAVQAHQFDVLHKILPQFNIILN